jgi:hypothetical protein
MKHTSYFRALLNPAGTGGAALRPVHIPAWGLAPAPTPEAKAAVEPESSPGKVQRPPEAPPIEVPRNAAKHVTQPGSAAPPRVPVPPAAARRAEKLPEAPEAKRAEFHRIAVSASPALPLQPGKAVSPPAEIPPSSKPEPRTTSRLEAPHSVSLPPSSPRSAPATSANGAMAAFVQAASASELSLSALHSTVEPGSTQHRQAPTALRPSRLSTSTDSSAHLRQTEPPLVPPASPIGKPQHIPARVHAELHPLVSAPQPNPPAANSPTQPRSGNTVHIGTVDIHIAPPPLAPKAAPVRVPATAVSSLARGFQTSIGLRQG